MKKNESQLFKLKYPDDCKDEKDKKEYRQLVIAVMASWLDSSLTAEDFVKARGRDKLFWGNVLDQVPVNQELKYRLLYDFVSKHKFNTTDEDSLEVTVSEVKIGFWARIWNFFKKIFLGSKSDVISGDEKVVRSGALKTKHAPFVCQGFAALGTPFEHDLVDCSK